MTMLDSKCNSDPGYGHDSGQTSQQYSHDYDQNGGDLSDDIPFIHYLRFGEYAI